MSNYYSTKLLVDHRLAELRQEADQERLMRGAQRPNRSHPVRRRWWERLMLLATTAQRPA